MLVNFTNPLAPVGVPRKTARSTCSPLRDYTIFRRKDAEVLRCFNRLTPRCEHKKSGIISPEKRHDTASCIDLRRPLTLSKAYHI